MKRIHVVGILLVALCVGIIISSLSSADTYASFEEAFQYQGKSYTVVGNLDTSEAIVYNPKMNANLVEFFMIDKDGRRVKVILNQTKPQDLEKSEDVVVKGTADGDVFYANTILLKCPSKYIEEKDFNS